MSKEKLTKVGQSSKWRNAEALIFTGGVVAIDTIAKGGWANHDDLTSQLISAGETIVVFSSAMLLRDRLSSKGKKKIPKN